MAANIEKRGELLAVNTFCKLYGVSREQAMRILSRGFVKGLFIVAENRYFIDNSDILAQARAEDLKPSELVKKLCRHSKR